MGHTGFGPRGSSDDAGRFTGLEPTLVSVDIDIDIKTTPITWHWLRRIGFRIVSTNCDHTPHMLWLTGHRHETGLEISPSPGPRDGNWIVWLRSDLAGNRSRFCYIRDVHTVGQLVSLMEAMTDRPVALVDFDHAEFEKSMAAEAVDCERRYSEYAKNARWSTRI